jgi:hypothetical protein
LEKGRSPLGWAGVCLWFGEIAVSELVGLPGLVVVIGFA